MTACASEIRQIGSNCFAKIRVATARCMTKQMRALLCEHLGSEALPNINREFIDCRESGNQRNARARTQGPEIKLCSRTVIWNCSCALGDAWSMLNRPICFRSATAGSFLAEPFGGQKTFRQGTCHKGS